MRERDSDRERKNCSNGVGVKSLLSQCEADVRFLGCPDVVTGTVEIVCMCTSQF